MQSLSNVLSSLPHKWYANAAPLAKMLLYSLGVVLNVQWSKLAEAERHKLIRSLIFSENAH